MALTKANMEGSEKREPWTEPAGAVARCSLIGVVRGRSKSFADDDR